MKKVGKSNAYWGHTSQSTQLRTDWKTERAGEDKELAITAKPHVSQVEQKHSRCRKVPTEQGEEVGVSAEEMLQKTSRRRALKRRQQEQEYPGAHCNESRHLHQGGFSDTQGRDDVLHKCPEGRVERRFNC